MKKLIYIIILSCKQATFYSSIKRFRKLSWVKIIQLRMHFMMCEACHEFDHQNDLIDKSLSDFQKNKNLHSAEKISAEKKSEIKAEVEKLIDLE